MTARMKEYSTAQHSIFAHPPCSGYLSTLHASSNFNVLVLQAMERAGLFDFIARTWTKHDMVLHRFLYAVIGWR